MENPRDPTANAAVGEADNQDRRKGELQDERE